VGIRIILRIRGPCLLVLLIRRARKCSFKLCFEGEGGECAFTAHLAWRREVDGIEVIRCVIEFYLFAHLGISLN
jgi:hypothetical protein